MCVCVKSASPSSHSGLPLPSHIFQNCFLLYIPINYCGNLQAPPLCLCEQVSPLPPPPLFLLCFCLVRSDKLSQVAAAYTAEVVLSGWLVCSLLQAETGKQIKTVWEKREMWKVLRRWITSENKMSGYEIISDLYLGGRAPLSVHGFFLRLHENRSCSLFWFYLGFAVWFVKFHWCFTHLSFVLWPISPLGLLHLLHIVQPLQFGDSQQLRLVRILRSTVMVRVGGGWMALDEFLVKNDPCRGKWPSHWPTEVWNQWLSALSVLIFYSHRAFYLPDFTLRLLMSFWILQYRIAGLPRY